MLGHLELIDKNMQKSNYLRFFLNKIYNQIDVVQVRAFMKFEKNQEMKLIDIHCVQEQQYNVIFIVV